MSLAVSPLAAQKFARLEKIEVNHSAGRTRISVEVNGPIGISSQRIENPGRIFVDFQNTIPALVPKPEGGFRRAPNAISVEDPLVRQIRVAENQKGVTRIVLDLVRDDVEYQTVVAQNRRLLIDVSPLAGKLRNPLATPPPSPVSAAPAPPEPTKAAAKQTKVLSAAMVLLSAQRPARPVYRLPEPPLLLAPYRLPKAEPASLPYRVAGFVFRDFRATRPPATPVARQAAQAASASAALAATSNGKRSLTRVLGLKIGRVVIDPGHGGHDAGSISRNGVAEKDLTLDVAKRLGALIEENLGSEVVYTRSDDSYVSLEERGSIANRSRADLFISIHANSSHHPTATGVETYYLNFTSSPEALEVAARENAVSERSVNELGDLIKKIALKDKIDESREFAAKVQVALYNGASKAGNRTRDRGVRKAPFVVLIGASMPSILTEIGFLSNAKEESLLKKPEYRQKIAEALFRGVSQYTNTLSHFNLAQMSGQGSSPE